MRKAFFTVYYNTPESYKHQVSSDCTSLGLHLHSIDVTSQKKGYAEALNVLIQKNIKNYDVFFLGNPDISMKGLEKNELLAATMHFDIWGYTMKQHGAIYYGGMLDPWRLSGGLVQQKPIERFTPCDFVSGSLLAVTQKAFNTIGYLDESFFMYYEDVEFCTRSRRLGLRVGIDSKLWYEHFETSNENQSKKKHLARNRMKFLWKYGTTLQKLYELVRLPKTIMEEGNNLL